MDTDDLSVMAYDLIVQAAQVSDTLKTDIGALCQRFSNEDDWLRGVLEFLQEIAEEPDDYLEYWNLEEEEGITARKLRKIVAELSSQSRETLAKSVSCRNKQG